MKKSNSKEMPSERLADLRALLNYCEDDEAASHRETGGPESHIYTRMCRLRKWMNDTKPVPAVKSAPSVGKFAQIISAIGAFGRLDEWTPDEQKLACAIVASDTANVNALLRCLSMCPADWTAAEQRQIRQRLWPKS